MAQNEVTPTTILPRHRSLTRQQVRADDKRTVALQLTAHDPNCLLGLPRELRDEIFWLAAQADADPARDAELVSRPSPTIRALTQVSRNVRAEVANIYWSRTKFHYSAHNLLRNKVHSNHCGHCRLRSWLSTWGKLAVPLVRRLDLTLSFHSGGLDMQLRDHTRPSFDVWIGNGFGAEESLKAYVTAALFPDDRPTMTTESLGIVCKVLYEVGSIVSNAQGYFLENGCVDRAERMEQKRAEVAELLNMDRMVSWHDHTLLI